MTELNAERTGAFLAALRKSRGCTQQEAAELLNVSNKTISKWESGGGFPEIGVLPALAELYGVTVDEILAGRRLQQESPEPPAKQEARKNRLLHRAVTQCGVFWAPGLLLVLLSALLDYDNVWGLLALTAGCAVTAAGWIWSLSPLWQSGLELPESGLQKLWRQVAGMGLIFALAALYCFGILSESRSNYPTYYYSLAALLLYGGGRFLGLLIFRWLLSLVSKKYQARWGVPLMGTRTARRVHGALYVLLACEGLILGCCGLIIVIRDYKFMDILNMLDTLLRLGAWIIAGGIVALGFSGKKNN